MLKEASEREFRENRSEVFLRFLSSAQSIDALHGRNLQEVLGTEENRRNFIEALNENEFLALVNGINGILRGKPKDEWLADGDGVHLEGWGSNQPPRQEDKASLLNATLRGAKEMNENLRSLEDIGILLGAMISEIHLYDEANGRTGRVLYILTKDGINREEIELALGEDGRFEGFDFRIENVEGLLQRVLINRAFEAEPRGVGLLDGPIAELSFDPAVPEDAVASFRKFLALSKNDNLLLLALYAWSKKHPGNYFKDYPATKLGDTDIPERKVLVLQQLTPDLRQEDMREVAENYWRLKKETAEMFIDCIANPSKPEYQVREKWHQGTILEYIKNNMAWAV